MTLKQLSLLGVSLLALTSCSKKSEQAVTTLAPVHRYGGTDGGGSLGMYTVRSGETVWMISQRYNLALRDILDTNHLSPPYNLKAGQRLNLPAPQTYRVRPGDTLYTISRLFNTSTTDIVRLNELKAPYKLAGGQTLRLPPKYERAPAVQDVAMRAPERPPAVLKIDREELSPLSGGQTPDQSVSQTGRYIPPPSSPSDYQDDLPDTGVAAKTPEPRADVQEASAVKKVIASTPRREGKFIKPVGGKIISNYGLKKDGLHNDGINIQAAKGDPVRAAESGVVVYTGGQIAGYGNLVLIRHADQYVTAYAHLDKTLVKKGDVVKRGQTIATVGATGSVDKPQLHFEIRKGTKALDPSDLVKL